MDRVIGHTVERLGDALDSFGDAFSRGVDGLSVAVFESQVHAAAGRPAADPQRDAVYRWHHEAVESWAQHAGLDRRLSLDECRRELGEVFRARGFDPPDVVESAGRVATGNFLLVTVPPQMMRLPVVLHEAAHGLSDFYAPRAEAHGPEFVALFCALCEERMGAGRSWLLESKRAYGVRHAPWLWPWLWRKRRRGKG